MPDAFSSQIKIQTEKVQDAIVIHLGGHVTEMGADQMSSTLDGLLENGCYNIIFDLSEVPFMSSTGLGQIMRAFRACSTHGGTVKIVNPQPLVEDVFRVTKLNRLLPILHSIEEALSSQQ